MKKLAILLAMAITFLVAVTSYAAPMDYTYDVYDGPGVSVSDSDDPFIIGTVDVEQEFSSIGRFELRFDFDSLDLYDVGEASVVIHNTSMSTHTQNAPPDPDFAWWFTSRWVQKDFSYSWVPVEAFLDGVIENISFEMTTGSVLISDVTMTFYDATAVPIPSAIWFLSSGLIGLVGLRRKSKKS